MTTPAHHHFDAKTIDLEVDDLWRKPPLEPEVTYRRVPNKAAALPDRSAPVWRVRLDLAHDPGRCLGLELHGEVVLGRDLEASEVVDLGAYDASSLGVSRQHAVLRPTETQLFLLDLGSTNGTWQNGHSIGVNMPYRLAHGDRIRLGQLEFVVKIIKRPGHTAALMPKVDWFATLAPVAQAITSELDFEAILNQTLQSVLALTAADEAGVWLVDEQTGELFLEASRSGRDDKTRRSRLPATSPLPGQAIEAGKPVWAPPAGASAEAALYVPLVSGGEAFGVVAAMHRRPGSQFTADSEKLLTAVADFAAVAVQNARLHAANLRALSRQTAMVTALNNALSNDLKGLANTVIGYADLLNTDAALSKESSEIATKISAAGARMVQMMGRLLEVSTLSEGGMLPATPCDMALTVRRAVRDLEAAAREKAVRLDFAWTGEVYVIRGDTPRLFHSARALLANALKYAPPGSTIRVELEFRKTDLSLRVRDTGPAIAPEDLPRAFDRYVRSGQSAEGQMDIDLGLALVRATAEAHRGKAFAQNSEGQGVVFTVTLPATLRLSANTDPFGRQTAVRP